MYSIPPYEYIIDIYMFIALVMFSVCCCCCLYAYTCPPWNTCSVAAGSLIHRLGPGHDIVDIVIKVAAGL